MTAQKYFLEKSDENMKIAETLEEGLVLFSGDILKPNLKREQQLGVFSKLLANTFTFLYDDATFLKKYPQGFFTENTMFIPLEVYKNLLLKEPEVKQHNKNSFLVVDCLLHINNLLTMLENQFNVTFSKEDRLAMLEEKIPNFSLWSNHMSIVEEVLDQRLEFVSIKDVKKEAQELGISEITINLFNYFKKDTNVINSILFKSKEIHNPKSKLHVLVDKVINKENEMMIENIDLKDFKEIYQSGYGMKNIEETYNILNTIVKKELNKANKDQVLFVENLKRKWIPFLEVLNDKHFFVTIENFGKIMEKELGKEYENKTREDIAHAINDLESTNEQRKKYLILSITDFSAMASQYTRGVKAL